MSEDFFVVLPSNASADVFPENRLNDFTVKLPQHLTLSGYSVALTELQYPCSWYDIPPDCYFTIGRITSVKARHYVRQGNYKSMADLVKYIDEAVLPREPGQAPYNIYYDEVTQKVSIRIWHLHWDILISDNLAQILGFYDKKYFANLSEEIVLYEGDALADLARGMTALYVYSSVVQPRLVGDTLAELLRCVPIQGKKGDKYRSKEFLHPTYIPCRQDTTDLIRVNIRRDNGELVPFKLGKVVATLHFKKTK